MKKLILRATAQTLIVALAYQLLFPLRAHALTTGPSTPEVQSFEPVGTTDMVNTFTGDFVYNIPLLDVEGYPVNLSYHSGITMEQEASWCGLGFNINPGEINRVVRGLPDDFNGDRIEKEISIKPEKNFRVGVGANLGLEIVGADKGTQRSGWATGTSTDPNPSVSLSFGWGLYANFNNYKGMSMGTNTSVSVSAPCVSAGIDVGIGSQGGADINANASFTISKMISEGGSKIGLGCSVSEGFNTRQGLKDLNLSYKVNALYKSDVGLGGGYGSGTTIPIGLQNYVPMVTNETYMNSFTFQVKAGIEAFYWYPSVYLNAGISKLSYANDGSRNGYGYLYSENASPEAVMDFSRDKDGTYNKTLPNLPASTMTYDIYSISGQGTGGTFRPFRNDIGAFGDPHTKSTTDSKDGAVELGIGNLWEVGGDFNFYDNVNESGQWQNMPFGGDRTGSLYEKTFFKSAGELTYNQQQETNILFNDNPEYLAEDARTLKDRSQQSIGSAPAILGNSNDRSSRADLLTYLTAGQTAIKEVGQYDSLPHFSDNSSGNARFFDPVENHSPRFDTTDFDLKKDHISEFIQTQPDGHRYVYGLPAVNHMSREVAFSVDEGNANLNTGQVAFAAGNDDTKDNSKGRDNYYTSTVTPAHTYSYMLTSVLSNDYVDVLGDGPTDDDLGTYVKFNYKLWSNDYRWRAPYEANLASYNPGFWSDNKDGKGSYAVGSKQVWQLRSIETKNFIAEFYVSSRADGLGASGAVLPQSTKMTMPSGVDLKSSTTAATSYKLDSIKLYNKHDRYLNENNAVPVKTVIFKYSNLLCPGIPNSSVTNSGKLTLERIYIKYGNSEKNLLSPYAFSYNSLNPAYNYAAKDRWANYKPQTGGLGNYEFPYVLQNDTAINSYAAAWHLTDIKLPSGGKIHVQYEAKDYSFVQDRRNTQMVMLEGIGSSPSLEHKTTLYQDADNVNDYVYFRRDIPKERQSISLADNYLEGQEYVYYSFNLDITGTGKYEHIKGYAKYDAVGICPNDANFAFIKLRRESGGNMQLPAPTVYGINTARYYLPHILYPGYGDGADAKTIVEGLIGAADELKNVFQNPFKQFIKDGKAKNVRLEKSWLRLQPPALTKFGGGVRVKSLVLSDNWKTMTGSSGNDASYGRTYDYTTQDDKYGIISSGVASYEPMVGGDENPFRRPVPYTADEGRLRPSIDFFQEEPYGESFFPAAIVGYSSVKVRSIHAAEGGSSQSEDEYLYYTTKDFPSEVDFTTKDAPDASVSRSLRKTSRELHALQGYVLRFNDMHGKPKAVNNYVIHTDGTNRKAELITGVKYNYNLDNKGKLDNHVRALVRTRGYRSKYEVKDGVILGQDMDFSVDSRSNYSRSYNRSVDLNLNVVAFTFVVVPIATVFIPDKEEVQKFETMVSTKIMQQYGILKSVEKYDHGAKTVVENLIYDGETGNAILTSVNNEFNDRTYNIKHPAHIAYLGMGAAYTNVGYEEIADSINANLELFPKHKENFYAGDELLLTYKVPSGNDSVVKTWKVWITNVGYKVCDDIDKSPNPPANPTYISCNIKIRPRYDTKDGNKIWPDWTGKLTNVRIKVMRSGRRNMLNDNVQEALLTKNPYANDVADLFGNTSANGNAFDNLLSITGRTYTDEALSSTAMGAPYDGNDTLYSPDGNTLHYLANFNSQVEGRLGNYRIESQYQRSVDRSYDKGHVRYDGTFKLGAALWTLVNNAAADCMGKFSALKNSLVSGDMWKTASHVTKYDIHGNAIEEIDALGNYSSAQYGYNYSLPVAVATNARQGAYCFDGFEDYSVPMPEGARLMWSSTSNLFSQAFHLLSNISGYSSTNATSIPGYPNNQISVRRSGQDFNLIDPGASGMAITNEANHTGYYSLKLSASKTFIIPVGDPTPDSLSGWQRCMNPKKLDDLYLATGKKYVFNCWVKPTSGTNVSVLNQISANVNGNPVTIQHKTGSIDGWYLIEGIVTMSATSSSLSIGLPGSIYVDDIRLVPVDAAMRSFVYDPKTFKPVAQLDENHLATFFEYDQEGLLIRTKKETEQGIKTISESRRATVKTIN